MKPFINTLISILLSTTLLLAEETTKTNKEQNTNKQVMTDEEFLKQFMQLDKEVQEEKAKTLVMKEKTKELEKLNKTADELLKTLGVDK